MQTNESLQASTTDTVSTSRKALVRSDSVHSDTNTLGSSNHQKLKQLAQALARQAAADWLAAHLAANDNDPILNEEHL